MKDRDRQLAELNRELFYLEAQKRESARHYTALINAKQSEIDKLATEILQGKESLFGSGAATIDADDAGNATISIPANAEQVGNGRD